jgi:LacI family transcriptional regulator
MDAIRGREVIETCRLFDLAVPDEVAVLAGDYDRLCCSLSRPPLSSMDISAPSVGFEAAALLDRMIRGEAVQRPRASVVPGRITTRPSTDVLAIDDRELAKAIRFIRAEASRPIQVKDVLAQVVMSRRVLEKRFREVLGRTPAEEIRRVRVEMARHMIEDTDLALGQIAPRCGFEHAEMLTRAFHRERGETPSAYRRRAGHRAETGRQ